MVEILVSLDLEIVWVYPFTCSAMFETANEADVADAADVVSWGS